MDEGEVEEEPYGVDPKVEGRGVIFGEVEAPEVVVVLGDIIPGL